MKYSILLTALLLIGCGDRNDQHAGHGSDSAHHDPATQSTGQSGHAMSGDMQHSMAQMNQMMVDSLGSADSLYDRRFIDMMIPHHEGAVMMAEDALNKAQHPELKKLAQAIIDSQKEIAQMKAWRDQWYGQK